MKLSRAIALSLILTSTQTFAGGGASDCGGQSTVYEMLIALARDSRSSDETRFQLKCADLPETEERSSREGKDYVRSTHKCVASTGEVVTIEALETEDAGECRENVETLVTTDRQTCGNDSVAPVVSKLFKRLDSKYQCVTRGTRTACFKRSSDPRFAMYYAFDRLGKEVGCATEATLIWGAPRDLDGNVIGGSRR